MLERIRDGIQGPWAMAIVALIVVSFVFTGVGGYLSSSASTAVAVVNGEEIPANTLEQAYQNERARMESQFGEAVLDLFANESYLANFRQSVLDRLIEDELIAQKSTELGLRVSDEQIKETIVQLPEFQLAGQFSNESYNQALQRAGFTPTQFAEYMRTEMTRQQLVQAINGSNFSVEALVSNSLMLQQQTRDISIVEVDAQQYLEEVTITEDEIQAYYDSNLAQYDTQEQVKLGYVSLSVADLVPEIEVTDEEVRLEYDEQIAFYQTPEIRTISHILIETSDDFDVAQQEAQSILESLNAGADFASLAEQSSDDIVSAEIGGELGELTLGDYPIEFEEAALALSNVGDYTKVVETEFGLHIIKLDSYTEPVTTPFADVAVQIKDDLVANRATDLFFEMQSQMERLAFEVPDTLDEIAEAIDRPVFETVLFSEGRYPAAVDFPQVQNVAFSNELIDESVNSELLQISDDRVMVVRVVEHNPERTQSLDEVRAGIETSLRADKAQASALLWAQNLQTAMFEGGDTQILLDEKSLAWEDIPALDRTNSEISTEFRDAAFALTTDTSSSSSVVTLNNGNVGVVRLNAVNDAALPSAEDIESAQQRIAMQDAQRSYQNFVEALKTNAKIEIVN